MTFKQTKLSKTPELYYYDGTLFSQSFPTIIKIYLVCFFLLYVKI